MNERNEIENGVNIEKERGKSGEKINTIFIMTETQKWWDIMRKMGA